MSFEFIGLTKIQQCICNLSNFIFDFASGKIIFQAFSLRDKMQTRIAPINTDSIYEAGGASVLASRRRAKIILSARLVRSLAPPKTFSFNLCRRRFVLNFSSEQTGQTA
jgi:hypothetical protein